jgi:hypothetical protein
MQVKVNVQNQDWIVDVPEAFLERCVTYAIGVIGQRATASLDKNASLAEKRAVVKERFDRIAAGDWSEGGGRAAEPVARELADLLRRAAIREKASRKYEAKNVPAASKGIEALTPFCVTHFGADRAKKLVAKAQAVAKAKDGDVI